MTWKIAIKRHELKFCLFLAPTFHVHLCAPNFFLILIPLIIRHLIKKVSQLYFPWIMAEVKYLTVRCQDVSWGKSFYLLWVTTVFNGTETGVIQLHQNWHVQSPWLQKGEKLQLLHAAFSPPNQSNLIASSPRPPNLSPCYICYISSLWRFLLNPRTSECLLLPS